MAYTIMPTLSYMFRFMNCLTRTFPCIVWFITACVPFLSMQLLCIRSTQNHHIKLNSFTIRINRRYLLLSSLFFCSLIYAVMYICSAYARRWTFFSLKVRSTLILHDSKRAYCHLFNLHSACAYELKWAVDFDIRWRHWR